MNARGIQFIPVTGAIDFLPAASGDRRFCVLIRTPDGDRRQFERRGGDAFLHAIEAIDGAGTGARISVRPIVGGTGA